MLDLKELERRLDDALEKETAESLTTWLNKQRKSSSLSEYCGVGFFKTLESNNFSFQQTVVRTNTYSCAGENNPSTGLALAA